MGGSACGRERTGRAVSAHARSGTNTERKPSTIRGYRHVLAVWLKPWSSRAVASLTYEDAAAVFAKMRKAGRSAQTQRNVFTVIKGVFDEAAVSKCIPANPVAGYRKRLLPKATQHEAHFLTAGQVEALASSLPHPEGLVVRLAAWSGLRAGELMGIRVRNVDPLRNEL